MSYFHPVFYIVFHCLRFDWHSLSYALLPSSSQMVLQYLTGILETFISPNQLLMLILFYSKSSHLDGNVTANMAELTLPRYLFFSAVSPGCSDVQVRPQSYIHLKTSTSLYQRKQCILMTCLVTGVSERADVLMSCCITSCEIVC